LNRIFTTNLDQLLDKALGSQGIAITEENAAEIQKARADGRVPIIYLHGRLDRTYQITESDVFNTNYRMLNMELMNALIGADRFVFVGYSMSDPDFRRIYMEYRQQITLREKSGKLTYFVMPPLDAFAYRLGKLIWEERGVRWIPLTARVFFSTLKQFLESRTTKEIRENIMKKYDLKTIEAYDDLVTQAAEILRTEKSEAIQFLSQVRR
jgi:hypothetical protein